MFAGIGASIALKSGEINLGGEGQVYIGGFVSAIILTSRWGSALPAVVAIPLAMIAAMYAAGIISVISGLLLYYKKSDFLFTSFIISAAIIPLIDGLIGGPFRGATGNLLATEFISNKFMIYPILKPSTLNISIFGAIIVCICFHFMYTRTARGRRLIIYGISHNFADYAGYNSKKIIVGASFMTGAFHGLCGCFAVCGTYFTCHSGFYMSFGWNALSVALIAGSNSLWLIPSSVLMAFIITYSNRFALYNNFGFDISSIIQAVILFLIANVWRQNYDS